MSALSLFVGGWTDRKGYFGLLRTITITVVVIVPLLRPPCIVPNQNLFLCAVHRTKSTMRHFTLMKLLTVSSFASSPDKTTPSSSARTTPSSSPPTAQMATVVPEPATANNNVDNGRRAALYSFLFTTTAAFVPKKSAQALDMDAFVNSQVCRLS
jgi:hypothetical protein